ncbi:MAG: right-handed parallel beta-helix repeat-containing protein [Methanomicrobia archaeon]|nr:right-handed parallel beta-helix repeat-containing protein [Methanomicrobia archaeon]
MKTKRRLLGCLGLLVVLLAVGLLPFTVADHGHSDLPVEREAGSQTGRVTVTSASPVHNLNTSMNFSSIQEAIADSNTNDSHIIEVDPGTYSENVVVNKSVTIRSSSGDPLDTVVEAANASDHVFTVTDDHVILSGFTIEGATGDGKAGIYLASSSNHVTSTILRSNFYGIAAVNSLTGAQGASDNHESDLTREYLTVGPTNASFTRVARYGGCDYRTNALNAPRSIPKITAGSTPLSLSSNNVISDTNASFNYIGIIFIGSTGNTVSDSIAHSNTYGILLYDNSHDNFVGNNSLKYNTFSGVFLWGYNNNNTITNNIASSNSWFGISLYVDNCHNSITRNTANFNQYGAYFYPYGGSFNALEDNNFDYNSDGIALSDSCDNNTVINNSATFNYNSGLFVVNAMGNFIGSNDFSHSQYFSGLELSGTSSYNIVEGNKVNSNAGAGIALAHDTHHNTLESNTVSYNKYSGISLANDTNNNIVTNNAASFNEMSGISLFHSSRENTVSHNELFSNQYGLGIIRLGGNTSDNQIFSNSIHHNNAHGIFLLDLCSSNNISNNSVYTNNIFGICLSNCTSCSIKNNTAYFNWIGIGLLFTEDTQLTGNVVNSNKIHGILLYLSNNNLLSRNLADSNTYDGISLFNSSLNNISANTLSSSYFGVSLYSSTNNTIADNDAASNYYFEVFIHSSPDAEKTIFNNTWYIQEDIIYGVSLSVSEIITPSLQVIDNGNATYSIVVENLGNTPDTFDLTNSSGDDPTTLVLEPDTVSLGPGERDYETIELCVGDPEPGIYRAIVEAHSRGEPTVKDSIETRTIVRGEVDSESVDSTIEDSALVTSSINDSTINGSAIINSTISGSTITESVITSSVVVRTTLHDVTVANAIVTDGVISAGTLTINGITYEIDGEERIADLVMGADYSDSNLVGIKDSKTLTVIAETSDVDFDISAKEDYFAGSMRVQKAGIPPEGIPEDSNGENVGGYVYADVSENVAKSTEWVLVRVYYDQTELGDIDESSLRLRYFNETAEEWEEIPIGGVNPAEHYVWANISHYSVFSVSGSVTPKKPSKSGGGGGTHADSDDDGLSDLQELILGTDKDNADTDGDGFKDGDDPFPLDPNLPLRSTSTPTPLPTATTIVPTPSPSPPSTPEIPEEPESGFEFPTPGFEVLVAIGGLLAVAYMVLRRKS